MFVRLGSILLTGMLFSFQPNALVAQSTETTATWNFTEARQFDFWIGAWDVNLRMIQPDNSWKDSVKSKVEIYPILDGKAILELWDSSSIKGFSLRYYDTQKKKWVLYLNWPSNSRSSSVGSLEGNFRHGRGEFFSRNGNRISRYTFCDITPNSLRWDDAFSIDGGKTWTNNWIMEFSRTAPIPIWPRGDSAHTWSGGGRCTGEPFDRIGSLVGQWQGEFSSVGKAKVPAELRFYRILGGCTVIRFLEVPIGDGDKKFRQFELLTWNAAKQKLQSLQLDNQIDKPADLLNGNIDGNSLKFLANTDVNGKKLSRRHHWIFNDDGSLQIESALKSGDNDWKTTLSGRFVKKEQTEPEGDQAINQTCPRSGKPVSADSLTTYRGHTVGFCNTHCRDDFAANILDRPKDRSFFDKIIDKKEKN